MGNFLRTVIIEKGFIIVVLAIALTISLSEAQTKSSFEKLLTVSDVEKVTGLKGVQIDRSKSVGWNLTFNLKDGTQLLLVTLGGYQDMWKQWKEHKFFQANVSGVGDEAFEGQNGSVIFVRKGNNAFSLSSYFDPKQIAAGKMIPLLNAKQLQELAKIIASRL